MTVARTRVEENTARRGFCEFIGKIMQQNQSRRRLRPRPNHAELQMLVVDVQEAGISDCHDEGYACSSARSLKRWILPVAVFGRSFRNSIQRGYLYGASLDFTCSCSARMSASLAFSGFFRTTKAFGLMSFCSSCQPTTAASSTSGCDDKAASTSNGETYIPETFNMSSARPQQT